jgi:peptidoglycan/xylan/chitin deacetylase (PgdA/CDA1 family)
MAPVTSSATLAPLDVPSLTEVPAEVAGAPTAGRGSAIQATPTQPPPPPTTLPPVDSCPAGSLIRSVDTYGERLVAFTFDDGPSPSNTRPIMSAFEARGAKATFFVVGTMAREYPSLMQEIVDRGHFLANHSITHRYSPSVIAREIAPMNRIIEQYTGKPTVYHRSPGLTQGSIIQSTLRSLGMCNVFTSIDLRDWVAP